MTDTITIAPHLTQLQAEYMALEPMTIPEIPEGYRLENIMWHPFLEAYGACLFQVEGGHVQNIVIGSGDSWHDALRDAITNARETAAAMLAATEGEE